MGDDVVGQWAFLGTDAETIFFGKGPFQQVASCPMGQTAFYSNSFDLSNPTPWLIPAETFEVSLANLSDYFPFSQHSDPRWEQPHPEDFSAVFSKLSRQISDGTLKKSVPVVTESAPMKKAEFLSLLHGLFPLHENLTPYGLFSEGVGFMGASPEILFESYEGKLKTMALAGTAQEEERAIFTFDEKEIQEHEFVAETLLQSLTPLGMTRRHERQILSLGPLIHFHTPIEVELYHSHPLVELIKHLHPTPALRPLPRTPENLETLSTMRRALSCPPTFGAPFGLYHRDRLKIFVGIRMIAFDGSRAILPAGCGVIEASRLTSEWRELSLKRESVKKLFRL